MVLVGQRTMRFPGLVQLVPLRAWKLRSFALLTLCTASQLFVSFARPASLSLWKKYLALPCACRSWLQENEFLLGVEWKVGNQQQGRFWRCPSFPFLLAPSKSPALLLLVLGRLDSSRENVSREGKSLEMVKQRCRKYSVCRTQNQLGKRGHGPLKYSTFYELARKAGQASLLARRVTWTDGRAHRRGSEQENAKGIGIQHGNQRICALVSRV